jgi:molybdopterin-guanine dinucleotide biosynthesis protein A
VLVEMLRVAQESPVESVVLQDGDRFRPLPCVLRTGPAREAAGRLLDAGERRLRDLFGLLRVEEIDEQSWTALDPERRTLLDVDEPADLGG